MPQNPWEMDWSKPQGPNVTPLPMSPQASAEERRNSEAANRDEVRTGIAVRGEGRDIENKRFDHVTKLANDYNADPAVKSYRVAIQQFAQALGTGVGPQADLALTYAFAKAMDPDSVVREAEQGMVESSQARLDTLAEKIKKEFGYTEAGGFTPEARTALRKQISNSVAQRAKVYDARRHYYEAQASDLGLSPELILGEHDAKPFVPAIQEWVKQANGEEEGLADPNAGAVPEGQELLGYNREGAPIYGYRSQDGSNPLDGDPNYTQAPLQQGVYGANEGIASTLGLPIDLMTAGMNLVPKGINALANTNIPEISNPVGGGDWMQGAFKSAGFIGPDAETTGGQFARRMGQSVGATAAALPLGGVSALRAGAIPLASSAGGGAAAAGAQQAFPGNPLAEFGAEVVGSGLTAGGLLRGGQRSAQRKLDEAVPTVADLKEAAGELYRRAEANGVAATPQMTRQLYDNFADTLRREGQLGPKGKITDADTSTTKAFNLLGQYADQPMRPTEMDTVRRVIADGRKSAEPSDQRLSGTMLDQFDDWTRPLAPEFDEARSVAGRYLQAEDLEKARELAGARASQFSGSGYENALRTEYRALDRANINGRNHFAEPVVGAIRNVSRGTPASNAARNLGRLAPTGVVSGGIGFGVPFAVGSAVGSPAVGTALGAGAMGLGMAGRGAATRMGIRNAEIAELTARNGGPIEVAKMLPPNVQQALAAQAIGQLGLYQEGDPAPQEDEAPEAQPYPLAGTIRRPMRGLFGAPR